MKIIKKIFTIFKLIIKNITLFSFKTAFKSSVLLFRGIIGLIGKGNFAELLIFGGYLVYLAKKNNVDISSLVKNQDNFRTNIKDEETK